MTIDSGKEFHSLTNRREKKYHLAERWAVSESLILNGCPLVFDVESMVKKSLSDRVTR